MLKIVNEKLLAIVTKLFKLKVDEKAKNLVMQELLKQTTIKEKKKQDTSGSVVQMVGLTRFSSLKFQFNYLDIIKVD